MIRPDTSSRFLPIGMRLVGEAWAFLLATATASAQVVFVSLSLDTNQISTGQETTLRAFAHIDHARTNETDRIFWWNVSLTNDTPAVARLEYVRLQRPYSDQETNGTGVIQGVNLVGIFDTFIGLERAGWSNAVELFTVPVTGLKDGTAVFRLGPGVTNAVFTSDFLVAPKDGGDPLVGADYGSARAVLKVGSGESVMPRPKLSIRLLPPSSGRFAGAHVSYDVNTNCNYWLEWTASLGSPWAALPGGPHNLGRIEDTNVVPLRCYRVRVQTK